MSAKKRRTPAALLSYEDVRWMDIVRRTVDGLAATAESMSESCDVEWMAMQYSLETLRDTVDEMLKGFRERTGEDAE